jgi:hypothetical protein
MYAVVELIEEYLLFFAVVGAVADDGLEFLVGLEPGTMTRCAHVRFFLVKELTARGCPILVETFSLN